MAMPSGRFFGFVIGGALPAAIAADWLTSVWDQNAGLIGPTPSAGVVEEVAVEWLRELLGLPAGVSAGIVTGCQMAHFTVRGGPSRRAAAVGWDSREGAPGRAAGIRVVTGAERHVTIDRALRYLGFGSPQLEASVGGCAARCGCATRSRTTPDRRSSAPGRQRQHRLVRSGARDRRAVARTRPRGCTSTAPSVSGRAPAARPAPRRRRGAGGFVGDGCAQVAERPLRLRDRLLRAPRVAPGCDVRARELSEHADAETARDAMDWNPEFSRRGARLSDLCGDQGVGAGWDRGDGRALL